MKETRRLLVMGTNGTIVLAWRLLAIQCHRVKNNPCSHTKAVCRRPHRPHNTDSLELGWVFVSDVLSSALRGKEEINFYYGLHSFKLPKFMFGFLSWKSDGNKLKHELELLCYSLLF